MNILITGGAGSIASGIILKLWGDRSNNITLVDTDENGLSKYKGDPRINIIVSDFADMVFNCEYDLVIHTAARKHVDLCEDNPVEAVKNNIDKTITLLNNSFGFSTEFLYISTDKAVNPRSIMGMTKRICEKIVLDYNKYMDTYVVRLGNVIETAGNVYQVFGERYDMGMNLPVTNLESERYYIDLKTASENILKVPNLESGHIYTFDMGKRKTLKQIIDKRYPDAKLDISGLKQGEKMVEELINDYERLEKTEIKGINKVVEI